eukprot:GHVP01021425.1.p1 GENE.GHVP01021425.1~~GHVP01021425.1.p1  ORF type:complete len:731 (-),score=136.33 GHVP01021425.1:215-2134(-)
MADLAILMLDGLSDIVAHKKVAKWSQEAFKTLIKIFDVQSSNKAHQKLLALKFRTQSDPYGMLDIDPSWFPNPDQSKADLIMFCEEILKPEILRIHKLKATSPVDLPGGVAQKSDQPFPPNVPNNSSPSDSDDIWNALDEKIEEEIFVSDNTPLEPPDPITVAFREIVVSVFLSGHFNARMHSVLAECCRWLDISPNLYFMFRDVLAKEVFLSLKAKTRESQKRKHVRRLKIAGVALGLGAATALTAGLAAPAMAAGVASLGFATTTSMSAFLTTFGGAAAVASFFGAGTASLAGWTYSKRIGQLSAPVEFQLLEAAALNSSNSQTEKDEVLEVLLKKNETSSEEIEDRPEEKSPVQSLTLQPDESFFSADSEEVIPRDAEIPSPQGNRQVVDKQYLSLGMTVVISGWLRNMNDFCEPWKHLLSFQEDVYTMKWEPDALLRLGETLSKISSKCAGTNITKEWVLSNSKGLSLSWPFTTLGGGFDNAWVTSRNRAKQAGIVLAHAICDKKRVGSRPVSLIGYSLGARVIFYSLRELYRKEKFNSVSNVILIGVPTSSKDQTWTDSMSVVCGRFINVYSRFDWPLGFLYRHHEWKSEVAGLCPVEVEGVENFDVTGIVRTHDNYVMHLEEILRFVGYACQE